MSLQSDFGLFGKSGVSNLFYNGAEHATARAAGLVKKLGALTSLVKTNAHIFLSELTKADLIPTIIKLEQQRAAAFFEPENFARITKRAGRPDFGRQLSDMHNFPHIYSEREKLAALQILSNLYADHIGAPRSNLVLMNAAPNSHSRINPSGKALFINRNSPFFVKGDMPMLAKAITHENVHNAQINAGRFSNPVLSRIYRANLAAYKKIKEGYAAYRWQPVEAAAHAAGDMAEAMVRDLVAVNGNSPAVKQAASRPASRPTHAAPAPIRKAA